MSLSSYMDYTGRIELEFTPSQVEQMVNCVEGKVSHRLNELEISFHECKHLLDDLEASHVLLRDSIDSLKVKLNKLVSDKLQSERRSR